MSDLEIAGPSSAQLISNARAFRYDADLERVLDTFFNDRPAYNRLPTAWQSRAGVYAELRDSYRTAVDAGLIPDDRTPTSATREEQP